MKSFYNRGVYILCAALSVLNMSAIAQTTSFNYTGSVQTYLVPNGVTKLTVDLVGGGGGCSYNNSGGYAGRATGELDVTPGTVLNIYVGGSGNNGSSSSSGLGTGGWNGGGSSSSTYGGGGGGASDIRIGGTALSNRVIVAAGGGGGGYNYGAHYDQGGDGGGLTGGHGYCYSFNYTIYSGQPGTQSTYGIAGTNGGASNGAVGTGGSVSSYYGGGGGGGYYGGGGGSYGGGGGGSSYANPSYVDNFSTTKGYGFKSFMGYIPAKGRVTVSPLATASGGTTFAYKGSIQTYVVPAGVSLVSVDVIGAPGGKSFYYYGQGGAGGRVECMMAVTPGQTYYIYVGGAGEIGYSNNSSNRAGGWNGGGGGRYYGGAGGGASDIRFGGTSISNRVIVAGGGGGGSYSGGSYYGQNGGAGGGLTGEHGYYYFGSYNCYTPTGGTQTGGGLNGTCLGGSASSQGSGATNSSYYSGGGGGYWGGGCGYSSAGGGGGSSYPASNGGKISLLKHTQGYNHSDDGKVVIVPVITPPAKPETAFTYTGSIQTYTVPTGVNYVSIDAVGASGGKGYYYYSGVAGCGGRVRCNMAVTPGQVFYIFSGGKGTDGDPGVTSALGGWNGGGKGGTSGYSGAGGGATDIRFGGTALSNRIIVAGGGGGSAYPGSSTAPGTYCGGDGGGLTGAFGTYQYYVNHTTYSGQGGSQSAGGNNGSGTGGSASSQGIGSNAASSYGAGGGGGYWGGGCGHYSSSNNVAGGGGGSSYPASASGKISSLVHNQGYNCNSDGYCIITPIDAPSTTTTGKSFAYTGSVQTYSVPAGITTINVDVIAASGGNGFTSGGKGGCGAAVSCDVAVTPGQLLYIYAGGQGANGKNSSQAAGGWNGGGNSYSTYGGAGGGASDIRTGGSAISNRLVVAGGGGGGGTGGTSTSTNYYFAYSGGHGGGIEGGNGWYSGYFYSTYSPTGGTQTGGGLNGTSYGGSATTQGSGNPGYNSYAAGGGGGFWGGGGAYAYSGGGGGSSYAKPTVTSSVIYTSGINCKNNGSINITPICTAGSIVGPSSACLSFTISLTDATSGGAWSSSNTSVATVNSSGVVTGVSAGTAIISYGGALTCGTVYATKEITITTAPTGVTGSDICQSLSNAFTVTGTGGVWSTSNTSLASIDGSGVATGVAPGTVTISYSLGSSCYTLKAVTVNPSAPVTGLSAVCEASTITLSNTVTGGTWSSGNTAMASVNSSSGDVTGGTTAGAPVISYTTVQGCVRTYPVTVHPLPATLSGANQVCKNLAVTLTETSTGGAWSSAATAVASVASTSATTGVVNGLNAGTTTITYTLPTGCIRTMPFTVNPLPVAITAPPAGSCLTDSHNPVITLVDGTPGGTFTSSKPAVATIASFPGDLTSLTTGTTTITYTLSGTGCIATSVLKVNPLPAAITGAKILCANAKTYLNSTSVGGLWTSGVPAVATVDMGTGIVTGVSGLGMSPITYTLPTGCVGVTTVTVNAAPGAVSGITDICVNNTTSLVVGGGGTWSSSNPAMASVTAGPGTGGGIVTGVVAGNAFITYTLPVTGCYSTTAVTVNPIPAPLTGVPYFCYGSTTTLNSVTPGGAWSASDLSVATVSGSGVITSSTAASGTVNIDYALSTGCKSTQVVSVNPLPVSYSLVQPSGITNYCAGGTGLDIQLNVSDIGTDYQLYNSGIAVGTSAAGSGGMLDFGDQTAAGIYTAIAIARATGCSSNMWGSPVVNVDPSPVIYTLGYVGATSNYCDEPGAPGVDITLSNSQAGFAYQLYVNGVAGALVFGTGSSLSFGPQNAMGTYTATAQDPVTFCTSNMTGSVTVGKNPLPGVHNVTVSDGGAYCAGGAGVHIGLDHGNTGIKYELYRGSLLISTVFGANSSLDFGLQKTAGTYTILANNVITGCTTAMAGSAVVTVLPLPDPHNVQVVAGGSSSYCLGGIGVHVELDGSDAGVDYQLYNGTLKSGGIVAGTTVPIDYGYFTSGSYKVVAMNPITGCAVNMPGSVVVATYPALSTYTVAVAGTGKYCAGDAGLHVNLSGSSLGVKYDLWNNGSIAATKTGTGLSLDFGLQTASGVYNVIATGSAGCTVNMKGSPAITINTLPAVYDVTVTNGGKYCAGSAGVDIGLSFSDAGISYQLYKGTTPIGGPVNGTSSSLHFGTFTLTGTYTIAAKNIATLCTQNMNGSAVVTINPSPVSFAITGGGSYCSGTTIGVPVGLGNSQTGISYQLFNGTNPAGLAIPGTGTAISFGNQTVTGLYTVVATDVATGCTGSMTGSKVVSIDPLPVAYNTTGGGSYCAGGIGHHVGLDNSTTGINYTLYKGTTVLSTLPGISGKALDFGSFTAAGNYTIVANTVISGCNNNMNGSATITVDPLPSVYNVTGGGSYCAGGAGAIVSLSGSDPGIDYQLYVGATAVGSPKGGTGAALDFGLQTMAGTYTAVAANAASSCAATMSGSTVVNINVLPTAYTVTGGGTLCSGDAGYHIYLSGSQTGVAYQLYNGITAIGKPVTGTGIALDFGEQTVNGTYSVAAANTTTGCANAMVGTGVINVNPAPAAFAITGGGNYCAGGSGVLIALSGSESGVNYQLYRGTTASGMPVGGTGAVINFGLQTVAGTYTVKATNMATTCAGEMTGSTPVVADPLVTPAVAITGTDGTSCVGDVVSYSAVPVNGGTPTYVWKIGGIPMGTDSSFTTIPVNGDVVTVVMTSNAYCASATTATNSVTMSTLSYVMPSATIISDPGMEVCTGTPVSMSVTTTEGGTAPGYSWLRNGKVEGAGTGFAMDPNGSNDGDVIVLMLRSKYRCRMADTVFSDPVVLVVDSAAKPSFTIESHLGPVLVGQVDTFIAKLSTPVKGIVSYQWYVQGTAVPGATAQVYINHDVYDNDQVTCDVTRFGACGGQSATGGTTVDLKNLGTKQVLGSGTISVLPNPNKGEFTIKGTLGKVDNAEISVELTNMLGQVVYAAKATARNGNVDERIKLSNTVANGMYILTLRSASASAVFHIIVEQ